MIEINSENYIGEGEVRTCYEHPLNRNLCIKILKPEVSKSYVLKETLYYRKISKRNYPNLKNLFYSDFKGEIETNLGLGHTFDLIRDETTGEISKTLEYYLNNNTYLTDGIFEKAVFSLKKKMIEYKIFTRDLRARNLCCKLNADGTINLIIIDGIGHRDFFPISDYVHFFSKLKVERTFKKWHFDSLERQRIFLNED
jgi:hypothetical protein